MTGAVYHLIGTELPVLFATAWLGVLVVSFRRTFPGLCDDDPSGPVPRWGAHKPKPS